MGKDKNSEQVALVSQSHMPVYGVEPRFCLPTPVQLKLKEKVFSLSGDDFKIQDANDGTPYFNCSGKAFSLTKKKTLMDVQGEPVLILKDPVFSLSSNKKLKVYAGGNEDRELFTFQIRNKLLKSQLYAYVRNQLNNTHHLLVLKGDWRNKKAVITLGEPKQDGIPVAKIYRPTTAKSVFFGADEYLVEITPGVDIALIVAMCIAFDEAARDQKQNALGNFVVPGLGN